VRHVVLDTTNPIGGPRGLIDDDQWNWLKETLKTGSSRYLSDDKHNPTIIEQPGTEDVLFVIHCHHTISTMDNVLYPPPFPGASWRRAGGSAAAVPERDPHGERAQPQEPDHGAPAALAVHDARGFLGGHDRLPH
jgi:hypothetical protein